MKHAMWAAILLWATISSAEAQSSSKTVPIPGPGPSVNYVWVTSNAVGGFNQNSVVIMNTGGGIPVAILNGPTFGFVQPYDIVGSPLKHRVFVSNQGAGTVTVVDSDTFQSLGIVNLPGGVTALGMSLSEDESAVFVAGADGAGPAVWQIDAATLSPGAAPIGGTADVTHVAEDCVVIRAGNAGGSGDGPGKVYFSVRARGVASALPGIIGVINLLGGPPSTIQVQAGPLASVSTPTNMDRTPDHRFVFVGCSKITGVADLRIIRIDPLTDLASAQVVDAGAPITDVTTNTVRDVSWRTTSLGANRGFILQSEATGLFIREIDDTGAFMTGTKQPATQGTLNFPLTIRFAPLTEQVYIADDIDTLGGYAQYNAKNSPLVFDRAPGNVASRCLNFAVMSAPVPVISDICPRAGPNLASFIATVYGAGFTPGISYDAGAGLFPATFIDSNTIQVDLGGPLAPTGLLVRNPNFQTATIDTFYHRFPSAGVPPPFVLTLPSLSLGGYRMISFPQYATLSSLQTALTSQLGPYNPIRYRIFFYRNGQYVEINQMAPETCDLAGESFWMVTRDVGTLTLSQPDVQANTGGAPRVIPLNPGFNMVSQPLVGVLGLMNWAAVHVTSDPTILSYLATVSVTSLAGQALVSPAAEYVNGAYALADPLISGRGYWIENLTTAPLYLIFDQGQVGKLLPAAKASSKPLPAWMSPPQPPSGTVGSPSSSSGCGFLGPDGLLLALACAAFRRLCRHRRLAA